MGASLYPPPTQGVETTSSGFTIADSTQFSLSSFSARRFNGVVSFQVFLSVLKTISAGSTAPYNLPDVTVGTLPAGWRPSMTQTAIFSTGYADGEADVRSDGTIVLRTTNTYSLRNATDGSGGVADNIILSCTFVQ
ncbi:hypothetical protein SEA_ISSMI_24 [Streptomyces phage Issmi]|uniref:Uncharacterized protein n=1 Tax=Streptomyces phage Issmi TaxID=2725628 RepID=A0A6M3SZN8_9CAUD|nr:hypothetical protein KGG87_gp24 [Streptomyces phage Issmi]QJD50670.1 hypothetical protein SEA_ISSMI_24 [Streptomyces phage Issmi]